MTTGCCGASKNVLKPSELNRKVDILHYTTINTNAEGIAVKGWAVWAPLWAGRKPVSGRDFFEAAANNAEKTVTYRIRYRKGILPNMRLYDYFDKQTYDIIAVLDDYYGDRTQTHLKTELIESG